MHTIKRDNTNLIHARAFRGAGRGYYRTAATVRCPRSHLRL